MTQKRVTFLHQKVWGYQKNKIIKKLIEEKSTTITTADRA